MAPKNLPPAAVQRLRAAVLAACLTALTFCVGDATAQQYPFGWRTRDVNDLGNQYVPYHAHLWDLLHGSADGGLLLNWQSGYGTSFLPDLGTYVASPFALLVGVFPRDRIDLAVYVITVLKLVTAAVVTACLLLALRPGRWWAAGLLGTSYALCGWTLMMGSYNLMWLDGLIAFPLLCLVGEWARAGRRPVVSVAVVALCWTANFYTAYMATIGATLVLVARLLTDTRSPTRDKLLAVGRAAVRAALGIGLTAPLLLTIVKGTDLAYPAAVRTFHPTPWSDLLVRLLPGTYGFSTPSTYIDTGALLLVLILPFHTGVPRRTRVVWTVLVLVVAASLQWKPTHLLWHAFTTPNGSPYRQTFVLSGVMVIAAWLAVAHGVPGRRQIACGAGALAALVGAAAIGADDGLASPGAYPGVALGLVAAAGALLLLGHAERVRRTLPAAVGAGLLIVTQVAQSALGDAWTDRKRVAAFDDYPVWGQRQDWQREAIAGADGWPRYRSEPGREQTVGNDPLAVGGQGAQYYSSLTPDVWARTLTALGGGWTSHGRSLQSLDNPVTDVLFSVGARVHSPQDPHQRGAAPQTAPPAVTRQQVPPLVTVRPAAPPGEYGRSPYRNQELLLGARVYTPGVMTVHDSQGRPVLRGRAGFPVTGGVGDWRSSTYRVDSACPAGQEVYLWAPGLKGSAHLTGQQPVRYMGHWPSHRAAMQRLGTVPPGGRFSVWVRALEAGTLEPGGIGCLDRGLLTAAEQALATTAASDVHVTDDGISARLPAGSRGSAVIAAPAISGWSCSVGGGAAHPAGSYLGLLSVPLDGRETSVSCSFTPPGLRLGEAVGGVSLLGVAGLVSYGWWRRRRPRGRAEEPARTAPTAAPDAAAAAAQDTTDRADTVSDRATGRVMGNVAGNQAV
jgi:Bacterial membrane protein YfhO